MLVLEADLSDHRLMNRARDQTVKALSSNDVHLWYVHNANVGTQSLNFTYDRLLTEDEKERCDRFRFSADRELFLTARWLVRTTLSDYADVDPCEWRFTNNPFGRPEIAFPNLPSLRFNLSHSRGMVLLGVTIENDIGVDVEHVDQFVDILSLARNNFSAPEVEQLEATSGNAQRDLFFKIWTLKEAYVKATGLGLSLPLTDFTVVPGADHCVELTESKNDNSESDTWWLTQRKVSPKYQTGIAVRSSGHLSSTLVIRSRADENAPTTNLITCR